MPQSLITDNTVRFLGKALGVSSKHQGLISSNIANIDTIGYQAKEVDFKKSLLQAIENERPGSMARTHPKHFLKGDLLDISDAARAGDAAAVDIDQEMTRLAENNIQYRTSVEMLLRKVGMLRNAITEGGR